jgi:hypothetical protein
MKSKSRRLTNAEKQIKIVHNKNKQWDLSILTVEELEILANLSLERPFTEEEKEILKKAWRATHGNPA